MQNPKQPLGRVVKIPSVPAVRHDFSGAQVEMIQLYRQQLAIAEQKVAEARMTIGLFLDYCRKEKGLSEEATNWIMGVDPDGKPYLSGTPVKK